MKQTLPEQLRLAADNLHKPFRFQTEKAIHKDSSLDIEDILTCLKNGWEILPPEPLTFPDPPEGREWWNPHKLTPEQVEVKAGWRLLLVKEEFPGNRSHVEFFHTEAHLWEAATMEGPAESWVFNTLRTRAPLPAPAPAVPLTAADVPPGSAFRWKGSLYWVSALHLASDGVWLATQSDGQLWHFNALMEKAEILRPGQIWQPCSKPAE